MVSTYRFYCESQMGTYGAYKQAPEQFNQKTMSILHPLGHSGKLFEHGERSIPSNVQIEPVTSATLPSYRRLITLLLPIRYPDKFYKDSITDTSESSLARVAVWRDGGVPRSSYKLGSTAVHFERDLADRKVIGGIQCRVEDNPSVPAGERQLYIQTIGVLAPYRQLGIATQLLEEVIAVAIHHHDNVTSIYAHVWEANTDALEWYDQRGFSVDSEVMEGYYRRLKPSGARVVRRRITIADHLATQKRSVVSNNEGQVSDQVATNTNPSDRP